MDVRTLTDLIKKVKAPKGDDTKVPGSNFNTEADPLPETPGHSGPNTVTGTGGGGIIGESQIQNQY